MGDFIDATQEYSIDTGGSSTSITNITNEELLAIPSTSDANNLIRLVNNPANGVNNLYILQANPDGEIRFLTKDAYLNNDVGATQPYNMKIDSNGKLYLYYTYNFITNPLYFSGWKDIMGDVAQGFRDINILEVGTAVLEGQQLITAGNVSTLFTTTGSLTTAVNLHTTQIGQIQTNLGIVDTNIAALDGRLIVVEGTSTAYTTLFDNLANVGEGPKALIGWKGRTPCRDAFKSLRNIYKPSPTSAVASQANQPAGQALALAERISTGGQIIAPAVQYAGTAGQVAVVAGRKALDGIGLALLGASVAGGAIALYNYYDRDADNGDANVILSLYDFKAGLYQDSLKTAGDPTKLTLVPYQIHKNGLTIDATTNNGFTTAGLYEYFGNASYPDMYISIQITSALQAVIANVATSGGKIWVIGDTIFIPKASIGGTTGNLQIDVVAVYTATQIVDLQIAEAEARVGTRRRRIMRRENVVSYDDIDTNKLGYITDTQAYTDYTDTGETLTYKKLTSRLNLLPTGASDIDVYTSTGQVGIGTTPATLLHTYHATDNILRIGTATNGKASIQFTRGTLLDAYTDFRLINDSGTFKLQYENNLLGYGDTGTDVFTTTTSLLNIHKNTSFLGNVGINVVPHLSYKLDIAGDINISTGSKYKINGNDLSYNDLTNKLTAGTNITINASTNEISATGGGTTYTAGDGIAISGANAISLSSTINNFTMNATGATASLPPDLVFTGTIPITFALPAPFNTTDKCYILDYRGVGTSTSYSFTIPAGGVIMDFLMLGAGGCGGKDMGAGGGGGAAMFGTNLFIDAGTYSASIGRGAQSSLNETIGRSTNCFNAGCMGGGSAPNVAYNGYSYSNSGGGGAGGTSVANGNNYSAVGGLGGIDSVFGGSYRGNTLTKATLNIGVSGGNGVNTRAGGGTGQICSAGGGSSTGPGSNGQTTTAIGTGTAPSNGASGIVNSILGTSYRWGGGGGGGSTGYLNASTGGLGGGGGGQNANGAGATSFGAVGGSTYFTGGTGATALDGVNGTGGGGGGVGLGTTLAGNGGSGIVIMRYRNPKTAQRYIETNKGTTDATRTFRSGMVSGNYKLQSVVASTGVATDVFNVEEATGDLNIGTYTGGIAVAANGVAYFKNTITSAGIDIKNGSINSDNELNLNGAFGYGNIRMSGLLSNRAENKAVWTTNALGTTWMIRISGFPVGWQTNIHNLVVWDTGNVSGLSSYYFGVWGFTGQFPYEGLLLSTTNKVNNAQTIGVTYGVVSSVGYFVITGIPIGNQVLWRLT